jgi:hypothetical protein
MSNVEVPHRQFRSHSGEDSEMNLITSVPRATPALMVLEKRKRHRSSPRSPAGWY